MANHPLCVDLDGTPLRTDTLRASRPALLAHNPPYPFPTLIWLLRCRTYVTHQLPTRAGFRPPSSNVLAYITGVITASELSSLVVFRDRTQPRHRFIFCFLLFNLFAIAHTWGISTLLAFHVLPLPSIDTLRMEIAHAIGISTLMFSSHVDHKLLSFR